MSLMEGYYAVADFSEFHDDNNERSSILAFTLGRLAFITSLPGGQIKSFCETKTDDDNQGARGRRRR